MGTLSGALVLGGCNKNLLTSPQICACMCAEDEGPVERSRPHKASFSLHSAKGKLQPQSASNLPGVRKAALPGAPGQVPSLAYLWLFFRYSVVGPCSLGYLPRGEIVPEKAWAPFPRYRLVLLVGFIRKEGR